ncbi:MAG: sigma-54 dependent transcriptional regulator [Gammaproteobacteria bacterium]
MKQGKILIVEDDANLREALAETLELAGYEHQQAQHGAEALHIVEQWQPDLVISDINMQEINGNELLRILKKKLPQARIILMTAYANIDNAVKSMQDGAIDYLAKPFSPEILLKLIKKYLIPQNQGIEPVAVDSKTVELFAMALRVAVTDATVMITGESGSGKEVLARYIHEHSQRAGQPFVAINCAAIPDNMLEATLFGYEKGAFTGAINASAGKFELAQGGTLLLDEISEMPLALQVKLLRVLQEKEVERLGGKKLIKLDVRIIATSNRDMQEEVKKGHFREDLFYRLNVFPLHWLPLCERRQDIIPLTNYLLQRHLQGCNKALPQLHETAVTKLMQYDWPGNVRELDNVIQRAIILANDDIISENDLQFESITSSAEINIKDVPADKFNADMKQHEYQMILHELKRTKGNKKQTAENLGISARTLRYKLARMREAGIDSSLL